MMKFVVLALALVAVSVAYEDDYHLRYHGPKHYPIITKHGVPLEPPAVREAKIQHHIAHEVASHGNHLYGGGDYGYASGYGHGYGYGGDWDHQRYHGPKHYPIITKHGVPLDTPAVREAKLQHHIAHEVAAHENHLYGSDYGYGHGYGYGSGSYEHDWDHQRYHGPKHYPIITKHGVPLDTPAVREAKIHHHIAHEAAAHGHHDHDYHYDDSYY